MLRQLARTLEVKAQMDTTGGWSTNHVQPMRNLASQIFAHVGRGGSDSDPEMLNRIGRQFDKWAEEVMTGGWSTQNLDFFRTESGRIFEALGRRH